MQLDGRPDAWIAEAVAAHERPLVGYVSHLLGRGAADDGARDVVQEAFARLCEQQPSAVRLPEWLFAVCRNLAIDRIRKERRMTTIDTDTVHPLADAAPDPSTAASSADESARATRLLATLPPRQQEAIRLKFQHELGYAEIASVMETNVNNVAVLIHTALRTLREQMK